MKEPAVNINRLDEQMEKKRWGPGDLATYSGVSYDTIYKIRVAERPRTSAEILGKLAQALGTSVDYLLELTDDPTPASKKELPEDLRELYEYFVQLSPMRQMFMLQLARLMTIDQAQADAAQRQRWMHMMWRGFFYWSKSVHFYRFSKLSIDIFTEMLYTSVQKYRFDRKTK